MATNFLSTANPFCLPSSSSFSPSLSLATPAYVYQPMKCSVKRQLTLCKAVNEAELCPPSLTKRGISISIVTSFVLSFAGKGCLDANAAILEAEDDEELMEKVKKDRKKRLERQGVINSSTKETEYLQDLVYKLSEVGQAIENNDLPTAGSVFGKGTDTDWVQKANIALNKLSSSPEEKTEVDIFNSSLASLVSSVSRNDVESSKLAFVSSASAFEKWTSLTGLVVQLKGL
ncbi:thylakoid lumenal 16.5 kDa protein, chloroplastic isoform X1 [Gastrolobium bilobum]|uniref:thylakoid lumenal 16.5 kDa protein, chloroplastic isoform X1 n=1 Tax=Gastrolobium bilobum TaxID=150636 RepID=UPI002AB2B50C|nr:thylakoid lumenal 16.5 kDa protein, chloroplastic isoform X1 [Gastrolobium bilobum]